MNILTFYAGREDNGDLYLYWHHPVFKNGMWQTTHKFEEEIYIGGNDILPEVKSLPHESKRVTMALVQGREEDLLMAVLRKVAECYDGKTIDNIIQQLEAVLKEKKGRDNER